jgi:hypothetical protein
MLWQKIASFILQLFVTYETDQAIIQAGGVATTPVIQIGSDGGKALYSRAQLSTDKTFGGTA